MVVRTAVRLGAALLLSWTVSAAAQSQGQGTVVSVSISSPASGTVITAPGNVTLTAAASVNHPNWVVLRVEYYAGTELIGSATRAPYAFTWTNVAAGSYSLSAKAIATNPGQARQDPAPHPNMPTWVGVSAPVTITVKSGVAQMYYIHPDHLNTARLIQDQAGNTVWRWDQGEPFGNDVPNNNPSGAGAFDFPLRFRGQYFDKETGLHYNYFRDYDPSIGRYSESDPIGLRGGVNTYAYALSDPITKIDPFGKVVLPPNPPPKILFECPAGPPPGFNCRAGGTYSEYIYNYFGGIVGCRALCVYWCTRCGETDRVEVPVKCTLGGFML